MMESMLGVVGAGGHGADSQVCTNGGLVLVAEPFIYILVHERCLADTVKIK